MNKLLVLSICAVPFFAMQSCSVTKKDSHDNFKQTISPCDSCHSGTALNAPSLDGMDDEYLIEQIKNFRFDKRGVNSLSSLTIEMSQQAKSLKESDFSRIANYYSKRPVINSPETVSGDINNGKRLYDTNCSGCHSSAIGRFFTNSPKISHLKGPYILEQLALFSKNKRSFYVKNKHKNKMVEVSKLLSHKEHSDITAYLKSN